MRWDIGDPSPADDRRHVMFAMAFERHAAKDNHLIVTISLFEGGREHTPWLDAVTREIFFVGSRHTCRCLCKSLAIRIIASPSDDGAKSLLHILRSRRGSLVIPF